MVSQASTRERIVQDLEAEERKLSEELSKAEARVGELKDELQAIRGALAALQPKAGAKKNAKSGITREDIEQAIAKVRSEKGEALSNEELKSLVSARLKEDGRALTGFPMLFERVVRVGDGAK